MILIPERASHWYFRDGRPCFQVEKKDGTGLRNATLKDGKALGLLPSVTSILKVIAKPELENWKITQAIIAALTLPRERESFESWSQRRTGPDFLQWAYANPPRFVEDEQVFAKRVVEDSEKQAGEAADFGRKIHKAIERWLLNIAPATEDSEVEPYLKHVKDWAESEIEEVHAAECIVVNKDFGYAGTMDLHCKLKGIGDCVLDFKTQGIRNGKPTFYPEWGAQLAAYSRAVHKHGHTMPSLVSIVINSKEPGPVFCEQWNDFERYWEAFCAAFTLWCWQKNYNPNSTCPK